MQFSTGKSKNKEASLSNLKFSLLDSKPNNRHTPRPTKRQRLGDVQSGADNGDASSDNDRTKSYCILL